MQKANATRPARGPRAAGARSARRAPIRRLAFRLVAVAAVAGLAGNGAALEHPQDGPHIDLRIRIEDDAVAVSTIVNLAFADELVDVARENRDTLHPVEWKPLEHSLYARLTALGRFSADGRELTAVRGAFDVAEPDPKLVGLFPIYGARALTQISLGWEYPLESPPETVTIDWRAFPEDTAESRLGLDRPGEVLARLAAGGLDSVVVFVEGGEPFVWTRSGASAADHLLEVPRFEPRAGYELPVLSIALLAATLLCAIAFAARPRTGRVGARLAVVAALLAGTVLGRGVLRVPVGAGAPLPTEAEALAAFEPLHANIYRAFDYTDESDVYDALARCVEGDLLERLYEEIYDSLVQAEAGGAVGSVQGLEPLSTEVTDIRLDEDGRPRFDVDARWRVEGAVFHWGHAHWRVQELTARYVVRQSTEDGPGQRGWRVADSEITEQVLVSATQDRPGEDGPSDAEDFEIPEEL